MASTRLVVMSISKMVASPSPTMLSTAMPTCVRSWARRKLSTSRSTNSRSQLGEMFIAAIGYRLSATGYRLAAAFLSRKPEAGGRKLLCELLQKSYVAFEKMLDVVDSVLQHGDALDT